MGTAKNRGRTGRGKPRSPRGPSDEEGARIAPAKHGGNKRTGILREGVNARIDVHTGGRCRAIARHLVDWCKARGVVERRRRVTRVHGWPPGGRTRDLILVGVLPADGTVTRSLDAEFSSGA